MPWPVASVWVDMGRQQAQMAPIVAGERQSFRMQPCCVQACVCVGGWVRDVQDGGGGRRDAAADGSRAARPAARPRLLEHHSRFPTADESAPAAVAHLHPPHGVSSSSAVLLGYFCFNAIPLILS